MKQPKSLGTIVVGHVNWEVTLIEENQLAPDTVCLSGYRMDGEKTRLMHGVDYPIKDLTGSLGRYARKVARTKESFGKAASKVAPATQPKKVAKTTIPAFA